MFRPLSSWAGWMFARTSYRPYLICLSLSKAGPMSALKSDTHENEEDQRDAKMEFKSELKKHAALHFSFFNVLNKEGVDGM